MAETEVRVRRAVHGWRARAVVECAHCTGLFVRLSNTRYCSTSCRFMDKVAISSECWAWTATLDRHGYGTFYLRRNVGAHRAAYELFRGPVPEGLDLDHLCRNPARVNPDHLEPVTRAENTRRGARWPNRNQEAKAS